MNYCNPEGFRNVISEILARGDIDAFYGWFDGGDTKKGAFEKGVDVYDRVIHPLAEKLLPKGSCVALDLGYGAGTKIQSALKHFDVVYGVDVHEEFDFIFENLQVPKGKEVCLLRGDGTSIPVSSELVDFVYSWAMFCHLGTIDNIKKYLKEIHRVLKPGGVGVLFFTRLIRPKQPQYWKEVELDMKREEEHTDGYREGGPLSRVRTINIVVSMWKMIKLVEEAGFVARKKTASWSEGTPHKMYHGQYGLVIGKPLPIVKDTPKPKSRSKAKKRGLKKREK
jgi:SAM-dependent methyltransferase